MPDTPWTMISASASLRLDTLIGLRWLALAGQLVTVLFVHLVLAYPLPLVECLALIALSAVVNGVSRARYPATTRLRDWPALSFLTYDALQLTALLYLTGGLENPFSLLLLVPLIVSATSLSPRPTVILGAVIIVSASGLALVHRPLPWGTDFELPLVYDAGVWLALVSTCIVMGLYAFRVAEEARKMAKALNAAERVLAREQHLNALDGLAAAAAHELGTPLATIALVAKELERDLPSDSPQSEDIALLRSQSQRCREILSRLTSLSESGDEVITRLPLMQLVEEVVEPYRVFQVKFVVDTHGGAGAEPVSRRNPAIVQGLANLVENAVDFAESQVTITPHWNSDTVAITISDDGPGFAAGIRDRIGEPYLTTRAGGEEPGEEVGGLGLGFFIAKTLLERSGASLRLANRVYPDRGAVVEVTWPREIMDTPPMTLPPSNEVNSGTSWREADETV
ncbi:MAG: ActS/PrrB/RegB family redox-sensitive histidine kinase [Alphaproteobacteria bacterium]